MTEPEIDPKTLARWLRQQKPAAGRGLSYAVALGAAGAVLVVSQAWLLANVLDRVIFDGATLAQVMPWLWRLLPLAGLRFLSGWGAERLAFRAAALVKLGLRARLFGHLQAIGPVGLAGESSGDLATAVTDGVDGIEGYYARFLPAMALTALVPGIIVLCVVMADWLSATVMVVTAPLIPLFMVLIGRGAEKINQRQWRTLVRLGAHFLDVIQGLTTLKLFNASRREAEVIAAVSDDYRRATMGVLRVAFLSSAVLEFFATVSIAVVAVLIGFRLLGGEMRFVDGLFVLLLAPEFYLPLRALGTHYHARMEGIGAAERIVALLETPVRRAATGATDTPPIPKHVAFDAVHFCYEHGRAALRDLSFEFHAGERLALVGPSGAGKTTAVSLLLGFIRPDSGCIRINGTDLANIDVARWREHLAWVPQSPRLFHGSLRDNIALGRPRARSEEIEAAARRARAHEFIEHLPDGYETLVGERGAGLSGGQIQRVALARAFLRDASLVILDEPTASLDLESEALVQQAVDELARDRTLLVVAHRLTTVRHADRIVVVDAGRIMEQGDHATLMRADGPYRRMVLGGEGAA